MVLTDERWAALEPLIEACRPRGKTPPRDLRRTIEAIIWRHVNGAKWRAIPAALGPGWRAAQLFRPPAQPRAWQRLLAPAQAGRDVPGQAFPDRTLLQRRPHRA